MKDRLAVKILEHEKQLTVWALEQGIIKQGQEVKIRVRVRKIPVSMRWKLTKDEWGQILSIEWPEYTLEVLKLMRKKRGGPIDQKFIRIPWSIKYSRSDAPSLTLFYHMNTVFSKHDLPFRVSLDRHEGDSSNPVRIGAIVDRKGE